jgi:hypothetical protein
VVVAPFMQIPIAFIASFRSWRKKASDGFGRILESMNQLNCISVFRFLWVNMVEKRKNLWEVENEFAIFTLK